MACAQSRSAGGLVVPAGYENYDSVRYMLIDMESPSNPLGNPGSGRVYVDSLADELGVTFEGEWGGAYYNTPLSGKRKGIMASDTEMFPFTDFIIHLKQRVYYALPFDLPYRSISTDPNDRGGNNGYFWHYNDASGMNPNAKIFNNTYDANDVSPYCEYPKDDALVQQTFHTLRYGADRVVSNGDEGRVILGMSDDRQTQNMMMAMIARDLPTPGHAADTANMFSINLELNIDSLSGIDTVLSNHRDSLDLPIVRIQVLFKQGIQGAFAGWTTLPMVPFQDAAHPRDSTWYRVVDQVISRRMYDTLAYDWRSQDKLQNGSVSHSWRFKQYHILLTGLASQMRSMIAQDTGANPYLLWGHGAADTTTITAPIHQDSLAEVNNLVNINNSYLEIRVLSTYRATVRVRGITFQDTIADRYFYRKPAGDSSYSCNENGTPGGFDSLVNLKLKALSDSLGSRKPREILVNDTDPWERGNQGGLTIPTMGYLDYLASRYGIYVHYREQDDHGLVMMHLRRSRISYDGRPPSLFENQAAFFYGGVKNGYSPIVPRDYLYYAPQPTGASVWPSVANDSMYNLIISRKDTSALRAYAIYTTQYAGLSDLAHTLRYSARSGLWHPDARRCPVESAVQGWGLFATGDVVNGSTISYNSKLGSYYNQRVTTPEEVSAAFWVAIADGSSTLNCAQPFSLTSFGYANPGLWDVERRTSDLQPVRFGHSRNLTRLYGYNRFIPGGADTWKSPTNSDVLGPLPDVYMGTSNTWKATRRLLSRMNAIYSSLNTTRPFKRFKWLNAYSLSNIVGTGIVNIDTACYNSAFLKVLNTQPVSRWTHTGPNGFIDSLNGSGLPVIDTITNRFVEVGMFQDSVSQTLVNRAALVVNTRLWPSLTDPSDTIYFNSGTDSLKDHCRSTLGDIDVRKIYMKVDTTQLASAFRSNYYVVRDLWHPDTTWLVKADSQFAVYIKPGDAKFLYFEKAYSIFASKAAEIGDQEFCFNNGRRVAERLKGTRTATVYTRNHKLYISYAAIGTTFGGVEHSGADNIATGYEEPLDTANFCARPSVIVGRNDTTIAVAYYRRVTADSGKIRVMVQPAPGASWLSVTLPGNYPDNSSDLSQVTPVITPSNEKDFVVLAAQSTNHAAPWSIIGSKVKYIPSPAQLYPQTVSTSMWVDTHFPCLFPTVASRPLDSTFWPIRYAWQRNNHIYYAQARDTVLDGSNFATTPLEINPKYSTPKRLDKHLPGCLHQHPSIAMNGTKQWSLGAPTYIAHTQTIVGCCPVHVEVVTVSSDPAYSYSSPIYFCDDYIVWESKLTDPGTLNSVIEYWPVSTGSHQPFSYSAGIRVPGAQFWGGFNIFPLDTVDANFHYPQIAADKRIWDYSHVYDAAHGLQYHDWIRILWQNHTINGSTKDSMQVVHWLPTGNTTYLGWAKTLMYDLGKYPSLGQTTDSLEHWTDSSMVPRSVAFQEPTLDSNSLYHVRITNGWFPLIGSVANGNSKPGFVIVKKDTSYDDNCNDVLSIISIGTGRLFGTQTVPVRWIGGDISVAGVRDDSWRKYPAFFGELRTTNFTYHANDQLMIPRAFDTLDLTGIQNALSSDTDWVLLSTELRKTSDSSLLTVIDTMMITKHAANFSTVGLTSGNINYTFPMGTVTDSAFATVELLRGDSTDGLERSYIERTSTDTMAPSQKRTGSPRPQSQATHLSLSAHPNPFNPTTWIELKGAPTAHVQLGLFDLLGKPIQTLYDSDIPETGSLHIVLNASELSSGPYLLRAASGNEVVTTRLELVK